MKERAHARLAIAGESALVDVEIVLREAAEHDLLDARKRRKCRMNRRHGDGGSELDRIAIDARADARKCERSNPVTRGELQRAPVTRCEQLWLSFCAAMPHRPDGMDHVLGRQAITPR